MKKILIGTGNKAKVAQYKELLKEFNLEIVTAKELNIPAPSEDQDDMEKEAILKAKYYAEKSGLPAIVDDGGCEIETLNGKPGLKSHRFVGHEMSDEEVITEIFKMMEGKTNR